jgi:hypothetical protein
MSTQADELESIVGYIAIAGDVFFGSINPKIKRLEAIIQNNGFLRHDTWECATLRGTAKDLRKLADWIDRRRVLLETNARERA